MSISLNCPSCTAKVKMPKAKLPPVGAWAVCPFCHDKFFISGMDLRDILSDAVMSGGKVASLPPRNPKFGRLSSSSGLSTRVIEDDDCPTRRPSPSNLGAAGRPRLALGPKFAFGFALCVLVALIAGVTLLYGGSVEGGVIDETPPPAKVSVTAYGFPEVQKDMLFLRRKLASQGRYNKLINYRGVESRVLKHINAALAPNACQEIVSFRMTSDAPHAGFQAKSQCADPYATNAVLDVRFLGGWAVIRNDANGLQLDVPVLPSAQREWNQGERSYKPKAS